MVQPAGILHYERTKGIRYAEHERTEAHQRVKDFLEVVRQTEAELAIAPEYFAPVLSISEILSGRAVLRDETLYVLPLECLPTDQATMICEIADREGWDWEVAAFQLNQIGSFQNSCAIFVKSGQHRRFFLQHKIFRSVAEEEGLLQGEQLFLFHQRGTAAMVLICSDANHRGYHGQLAQETGYLRGLFVAHVQWNRRPDFPEYDSLREAIFSRAGDGRRVILSLNWAKGSQLLGEKTMAVIETPRTRVFCSRTVLMRDDYVDRSEKGLHLQHFLIGRSGVRETWHYLPDLESASVLDLVRPFENLHPQLVSRRFMIRQARYYQKRKDGEEFREEAPKDLVEPFLNLLRDNGVPQALLSGLQGLVLCEWEDLCNSCLARKIDASVAKDPAHRIPTAPLFCNGRKCDRCGENRAHCADERQAWEEATKDIAQCFITFWDSTSRQTFRLTLSRPAEYPLNLSTPETNSAGWLFYARGENRGRVEKKISRRLRKQLAEHRRSIVICPIGFHGEMPSAAGIMSHLDKSKIPRPRDVTDPDATARLKIMDLSKGDTCAQTQQN